LVDICEIEGVVMRRVIIGVLPVPSTSEKTGNGRTGVRETADSRRVLGEDVMTLVHERELMVVEKELTTHYCLTLAWGSLTRTPISPSPFI
jgi:hypothetical protein